jgi:hypothetical protein
MCLLYGARSHFLHAAVAAVIAAAPTVNRGALRQKGGATLTYACRLTRQQQQQQLQSVEQQQVQVQADVPPIAEVRLHQLVGRRKGGPGEGYSIVVRLYSTV